MNMKLMEWFWQVRRWIDGRMACGGRRSGEMRCDEKDRAVAGSQLPLPGMSLQREWTYGKLRRG